MKHMCLIIVILFSLTACGKSQNPVTPVQETETTQTTIFGQYVFEGDTFYIYPAYGALRNSSNGIKSVGTWSWTEDSTIQFHFTSVLLPDDSTSRWNWTMEYRSFMNFDDFKASKIRSILF